MSLKFGKAGHVIDEKGKSDLITLTFPAQIDKSWGCSAN